MGKFTALLCFALSSSAFATSNSYDLKMDLSLYGRHVSSPRVPVKEGETAVITQESNGTKTFIEIVATEKPTRNTTAIVMKFVVGTISPAGEKTIVAAPQLTALENETAKITVGGELDHEDVALSVVATRKAL